MKITLVKQPYDVIVAFDEGSEEIIKSIKMGEPFSVDYKPERNTKNHRRWFAFINTTFDMQEHYTDKEAWRGVMQIYGGHCKTVVDPKGNTHIWPESISYKVFKDEEKFKSMFKRAVDAFLERYQQRITEDEFLQILEFAK